jgi:hypothetical protein
LPVGIIAHRLANEAHAAGQSGFGDKLPRPTDRKQFVLSHSPVAVCHEMDQHREGLAFQRLYAPGAA